VFAYCVNESSDWFEYGKGLSGSGETHWLRASGERHGRNRRHGFPEQIEVLQAG
jgi:hypothetical protein